jgi:hypothetical protein
VKIEKMDTHAYMIPSFPEWEKAASLAQWKALVQLAEEKLDDFLVKLKLLVEEKLLKSLVRLGLNHDEEKNSPQFGPPKFPLQLTSRGWVPMEKND